MTRRIALVLTLALASLAAEPVVAQQADTYVVQPGDTLFRISRANGLTVEALRALNGLEDNYITVGQTLRLTDRVPQGQRPRLEVPDAPPGVGESIPMRPTPDAPEAPTPRGGASDGLVHIVKAGETLFRIALRYDTSVDDLRRLNGITGDQIEIGQRLVVGGGGGGAPVAGGPVPIGPPRAWSIDETTVAADLVHFVEPGETLYSIAAALRIDVDDLARLNALSTAPLAPGTMLRLPVAVNPAVALRADLRDPDESGLALVYPDVMSGRPTESGEAYDPLAFTVSHRTLPFGTVVLVTNPASGRSTFARVTDRGPVSRSYLVELSAAAATALELDPNAARRVDVREVR